MWSIVGFSKRTSLNRCLIFNRVPIGCLQFFTVAQSTVFFALETLLCAYEMNLFTYKIQFFSIGPLMDACNILLA